VGEAGEAGGVARIAAGTTLVRAPSSLERRTEHSVVVLGDTTPIVLRGTGVAIWDAFASARSVDSVATMLARRYDASPNRVLREMLPVLEGLLAAGALRIPDQVPY
jgi:Coenzyme PQQ synthesis protein D (PqqD)